VMCPAAHWGDVGRCLKLSAVDRFVCDRWAGSSVVPFWLVVASEATLASSSAFSPVKGTPCVALSMHPQTGGHGRS
jgi:hypothetical protein